MYSYRRMFVCLFVCCCSSLFHDAGRVHHLVSTLAVGSSSASSFRCSYSSALHWLARELRRFVWRVGVRKLLVVEVEGVSVRFDWLISKASCTLGRDTDVFYL